MILPLSIARWSQDNHKTIPSAALFLGFSTFNLSGVINVSLFWIIRRGRLLFTPPEETSKSEIELVPPSPGSAMSPDTANDNQGLQPIGMVPLDDLGERPRSPTSGLPANTLASIIDDI
jgi:hypothetical protein